MRKLVLFIGVLAFVALSVAPAFGQVTGYETPAPSEEVTEPPLIEVLPTEIVAPVDKPAPPAEAPEPEVTLAATGFAVTTGMVAALLLLGGGIGMVRMARRRRNEA